MGTEIIRIAGFADDSIVDGKGIRFTVFTQGCPHGCPGCHNPETHDFAGGREISVAKIIEMIDKNPLLDGVTFSGGEPMLWPEQLLTIGKHAKKKGLDIWLYTGYTFEELMREGDLKRIELLSICDVVVDGRFILSQRTLDRPYAGSKNQRFIKGPESVRSGRPIFAEL